LKVLNEDPEVVAGDAVFCKNCKAVFNMHSILRSPTLEESKLHEIEDEAE